MAIKYKRTKYSLYTTITGEKLEFHQREHVMDSEPILTLGWPVKFHACRWCEGISYVFETNAEPSSQQT